jgi:hypothetical protein
MLYYYLMAYIRHYFKRSRRRRRKRRRDWLLFGISLVAVAYSTSAACNKVYNSNRLMA